MEDIEDIIAPVHRGKQKSFMSIFLWNMMEFFCQMDAARIQVKLNLVGESHYQQSILGLMRTPFFDGIPDAFKSENDNGNKKYHRYKRNLEVYQTPNHCQC
jgi:hypothetical protein